MVWVVHLHPDFIQELLSFSNDVQDEFAASARRLEELGPQLSRPYADTLNGSKHANMKELRFKADNGIWRAAFAFDPQRNAIILVAADKSGINERRFYKQLIAKADKRYDTHLKRGFRP